MKAITKLISIFIISLVATACATTPVTLPEKYSLDNELVEATEIYNFRINSWEPVDNQSLIFRTDVNDYYLIILQQPALSLPFSENIGVTLTVDKVKPGYDNVVIKDSAGIQSYIIHKIYKLKDQQQAIEIKKRLKIG
jgi:hypothetical protein